MPVMRYTPQFVERKYIPTQNIGIIDEVLGQRQKEYDMAKMAEMSTIEELYGLPTTQGFQPKRDELVKGVESQIQEAVQRRGGDYGAAVKDIMGVVSKVKSDPFFQRNRRALEEAQYLQRLRAQNPALMVFRDPNTVAYDPNLSDEDLQYQVFDPDLLDKDFQTMYGDLAKQRREGMPVYDPTSGYNVATTTYGLTQDEVNKMIQDENTYQTLLSKYPVLQNASPEALGALRERIATQARGLSQGYGRQLLNPPTSRGRGTEDNLGGRDLLQSMGYTLLPSDLDEAALYNAEALNELAVERAKTAGININSFKELQKLASTTTSGTSFGSVSLGSPIMESKYTHPQGKVAGKIIKEISKELGDPRFAMQKYDINTLVYADRSKINEAEDIRADLETNFRRDFSQFEPLTPADKRAKEKIKDKNKVWVTGIVPTYDKNSPASIVVIAAGEDDKGNPIEFKQYLKRDPNTPRGLDPYESKYLNFLGGLSDGFMENFYLRTNPQMLVQMGYAPEAVEKARRVEEANRKYMIESQRNK